MSLSIKFFDTDNTNLSVFSDSSSTQTVYLIIIYNLLTNKEDKIFYSFNSITSMTLLGSSENIILSSRSDGVIDLYDMNNIDEQFFMNFETKVNLLLVDNIITDLKYKLVIPCYTHGDTNMNIQIINTRKRIIDNAKSKIFKVYTLNVEGILSIYETYDNSLSSIRKNEKSPLKKINEINLKNYFANFITLKCIDFNYSRKTNNFSDIIIVLCNYGLVKITMQGKEEFNVNIIQLNEDEGRITAFDISDTGHILASLSDHTIKIYDEDNNTVIFQSYTPTLSTDTIIDKIYWANIICKNDKNKLVRISSLSNFYLITSKNEFIIYDLNQKNKADIKVNIS